MCRIRFLFQGETGIVVELGNEIDPVINTQVHALSRRIERSLALLVEAVIPTYRSLFVVFDPLQISRIELISKIQTIADEMMADSIETTESQVVVIPTLYGGDSGPDLEFVASHNNLTAEEVIRIHSLVAYRIYMIGFTPGFPYLGGMSEKISAPRLNTPRTKIQAGSVGIAGTQTGLYPVESPGGWQLIGRTPLKVFNPLSQQPFLYSAGDFLKFEPISVSEFHEIQHEVELGSYLPQKRSSREVSQ
jgi:inhibitor of KinA